MKMYIIGAILILTGFAIVFIQSQKPTPKQIARKMAYESSRKAMALYDEAAAINHKIIERVDSGLLDNDDLKAKADSLSKEANVAIKGWNDYIKTYYK